MNLFNSEFKTLLQYMDVEIFYLVMSEEKKSIRAQK